MFQLNLNSFCNLCNERIHGMVLINSLKHSKTYIRFFFFFLVTELS
jgi:hypothetical protein